MNPRQLEAEERRDMRPTLPATERAKLVRRCRASYLDLSISRREWESRYPLDVREDALHSMTLSELRCRG